MAWLVSWAAWLVIQFIGKTSRVVSVHHAETKKLLEENKPVLFAFWHRFQLLMVYEHRGTGVNVLVSQSRDGELIAQALHRFGFKTARGSSSRGGSAAFMELLEFVEKGGQAAFTPDGPRGPYRSVQPGLVALAQKTGAPIIPIGWAGARTKELSSWDRFLIPLPFSKYVVYFDAPLTVPAGLADAGDGVRKALDTAVARAEQSLKTL